MELLTNPIIWLLVAIAVVAVIETKKSKNRSPKSVEPNKTSYKRKPTYASSGLPKQKTASVKKKTATKKVAKKKVAKKKTASKKTKPKT
tara:strand:+ start:185 stop:451 length:267 start_codon:yes stop_codon:yes gene_type:complete